MMGAKQRMAWCCSIGLLLLTNGGAACAEGHLKVTLSEPSDKTKAESGMVHFKMENTGDEPVYVLSWKTPFGSRDERLPNPQFDVYDPSGKIRDYKGLNLNFGGITPESFIRLMPNQSMDKDVDLASDYRMTDSGEYSVTYSINLRIRPEYDGSKGERAESIPANKQSEASSNTLKIWINPSLLSARKDLGLLSVKVQEEKYACSAEQLDKLDTIKSEAATMVQGAWDYLNASYQFTYDQLFDFPIDRDNKDELYVNWFGIYDKSIPYTLPADQTKDNAWVDGVIKATLNRLGRNAFTYDCGCDPEKYPQDGPVSTLAWAESSNPYKMHICDNFWKKPVSDNPTSQVGTIIHEVTHYDDIEHQAAADYAYGSEYAHNLAVTDRYKAVRNADNYLYYIWKAFRM